MKYILQYRKPNMDSWMDSNMPGNPFSSITDLVVHLQNAEAESFEDDFKFRIIKKEVIE